MKRSLLRLMVVWVAALEVLLTLRCLGAPEWSMWAVELAAAVMVLDGIE